MSYIQELRALIGSRPLIVVGTGVLLLKDDKVLLQRREDNGMWALPGGFMELGESVEEAALREVQEEVGVTIQSMELVNVYSGKDYFFEYPNGDQIYDVCIVYKTKNFEGTLSPEEGEVLETEFFALDLLPNEISPLDRLVLEDYLHSIHGA